MRASEQTPDGYCKGWAIVECDYLARIALGLPAGIARRERAAEYRHLKAKRAA